ncbi:hypothetical protein AVEN_108545-1 [Araneus ventricosus]|uniref:Uncharacterized protein n=1 Tax=Araneus ventricosus TaxID=182803 RepID=A0A4Y2M986_ARAVE|nr:hypothetical protein AVEN_108545-1 [Araneus ventricosus]
MDTELLYDVSTGRCRPFVPKEFRLKIFETLHNLSHPGVKLHLSWMEVVSFGEATRKMLPNGLIVAYLVNEVKFNSIRGPHLAVSRSEKHFTIQVETRQQTVSIDRLKPAFQLAGIQLFRVNFSI